MIRRLALFTMLVLCASAGFAQEVEKGSTKSERTIEKPARDFVMMQLTYDAWMKPDSVHTKGFGRGANIYICYDFPIKKSNFSFAAGIGIGTSNIFLDNQEILLNDSTKDQAIVQPESNNYKRYKLTTAYLEAPFELRFYGNKENRNRGFKAAIGLRAGTLLGAHTKARLTDVKIVEKVNTKRFLDTWRFAGTLRVGWGNFSVFGAYNLNTLYKENQGPEITPYSIGICLTGL